MEGTDGAFGERLYVIGVSGIVPKPCGRTSFGRSAGTEVGANPFIVRHPGVPGWIFPPVAGPHGAAGFRPVTITGVCRSRARIALCRVAQLACGSSIEGSPQARDIDGFRHVTRHGEIAIEKA